jgi:arginyl-tRNA synthetase
VAFGLMKFEGKKMSTRRGKVVFLDDVLDEAVRKAEAIIAEKNPELPNAAEVAAAVGVGAIVFGDLKNSRQLEVNFSLEDALRFEGETGPYVQYTYARAVSLLDKGLQLYPNEYSEDDQEDGIRSEALTGHLAWECLKQLTEYPDAIRNAVRENEPSILARYLLETSKKFNRYYRHERVLSGDEEESRTRLLLTAAIAGVLKSGLALLGIQAPRQL